MHKPRSITRANARRGKQEEKLTMRSSSGYMDTTPYFALKGIEKSEKNNKRKTA